MSLTIKSILSQASYILTLLIQNVDLNAVFVSM